MKKIKNYILLFITLFLTLITKTYAQELDIQTLGKLVLSDHPKISSFYVIGEYVFTSDFIASDNLNTQDIMISARSIDLKDDHTELIKGTTAYNKMSIYTIRARKNIEGKIENWYVGDNLILNTSTIDDNAKLNIKYIDYKKAKDVYTVTFKDDKNVELEKQYVISGTKAVAPKIEEREGYDFVGWFKCTDGNSCENVEQNKFDLETKNIDSDITLKAKWEIHKFNVTFDTDGGEGSISNQEIEYNKKASRPEVSPTKEGYDFKGWFKCTSVEDCSNVANEKTEFDFNGTEIKKDIKLKAKWEIKKFTVEFVMNGHGTQIESQTIEYNNTAKKPQQNPSDEAYKFIDWYQCIGENNACTSLSQAPYNFETKITKDIKLQAKWEQIKRTVKFKGVIDGVENDNLVKDKASVELTYPFKLGQDQIPTENPAGYKFLGWYDETNTKIGTLTDRIFTTETYTITGKWETIRYTVTFKIDNSTTFKEVNNLKYNEKVANPGTPEKPDESEYVGYKFENWYQCTGENNSCLSHAEEPFDFNNTEIKDNINVVAEFKTIVYTNKMVSDYIESLNKTYFDAYLIEDSKIKFDILKDKGQTLLQNVEKTNAVIKFEEKLKVAKVKDITITYGDNASIKLEHGANQATISNGLQTLLGSLVGSFESANLSQLDKKTFRVTINLDDNITNTAGNNSDSYDVEFISEFAYAENESQLIEALKGEKPIILTNSFDINSPIEIKKDTVIDGDGNTITSNTNNKYLIEIENENAEPQNSIVDLVLKDINLKIDTLNVGEFDLDTNALTTKPNVNKNTVGVLVKDNTALTVTNVQVLNKDKITDNKNAADFNEKGLIYKLNDKELHTYNVSLNENAAVELHGSLYGSGLTYQNEFYNSPTVLVAEGANYNLSGLHIEDHVELIFTDESGHDSKVSNEFVHYYNDASKKNIINIWYSPKTRNFVPVKYFEGEHYIVPKAFQEGGKQYTYTDATTKEKYQFTGKFYYYGSGSQELLSIEELTKKTVTSYYNNRLISAQYEKIGN